MPKARVLGLMLNTLAVPYGFCAHARSWGSTGSGGGARPLRATPVVIGASQVPSAFAPHANVSFSPRPLLETPTHTVGKYAVPIEKACPPPCNRAFCPHACSTTADCWHTSRLPPDTTRPTIHMHFCNHPQCSVRPQDIASRPPTCRSYEEGLCASLVSPTRTQGPARPSSRIGHYLEPKAHASTRSRPGTDGCASPADLASLILGRRRTATPFTPRRADTSRAPCRNERAVYGAGIDWRSVSRGPPVAEPARTHPRGPMTDARGSDGASFWVYNSCRANRARLQRGDCGF